MKTKLMQLKRMQLKLPLGLLWAKLEPAKLEEEGELDIDELLELMEKSVLLLGQANVLVNCNRRMQFVTKFFFGNKRAHTIVKQNGELLVANRKYVFGEVFYSVFYKQAKGTKKGKEIRQSLGPKF